MVNGKDYWCFSILGRPLTKKRARIFNNTAVTPDSWYEKMIKDAFHQLYPDMLPIGHEYYDISERNYKGKPKKYYRMKKGYTELDLPTMRLYIVIYINDGKIGDDDNYVKAILDALNRTLYMDDRMVKVPTPYIIVDPYEDERVDIFAVMYNQNEDKHLQKIRSFISNHKKEIDIYDDYELDRLHELTVNELYSKLCWHLNCPKWDECNFRRKDDIINCKLRLKMSK